MSQKPPLTGAGAKFSVVCCTVNSLEMGGSGRCWPMLDAGVCALWIEQSFQQAVRYRGCLKRLRQRYQLGDLSVEMKESSFLPLYFLPFGFILLSLFFYLLGTIFFICISWQHCLWFSCCLHKYAYIQDCQEKERKKKCCGTN